MPGSEEGRAVPLTDGFVMIDFDWMTQEAWSLCHYCHDSRVVGTTVDIDGTTAHQGIQCTACGCVYTEVYTASHRILPVPASWEPKR